MNNDQSSELASLIALEKCAWVSGLYVLDEGPSVAVIVVSATPEVFDIAVYDYNFLGFGPSHFFTHERLVWPVGADLVYLYSLCDETRLEIDRSFSISEVGDERELIDLDADDPEEIAQMFCRHLSKMAPLNASGYSIDDLIEGDAESFEKEFPHLMENDAPDFWA